MSLGQSDLNTVRSQARRILEHLLKLDSHHPPSRAPSGATRSLRLATTSRITSRRACVRTLRPNSQSSSGAGDAPLPLVLRQYGDVEAAKALPATCPYDLDQSVGHDW
jgi:hypothetical protein